MRVEHFMTKNPVTCDVDLPVAEVADLMARKGVGSVLVLEDGRLAGIVTDRDLCTRVLARGVDPLTPVEEVLSEAPIATVSVDDHVFAAVEAMRSAGVVRRLPVLGGNGEVVGVVSLADVATVAKPLLEAILLEETTNALEGARIVTGGKRFTEAVAPPAS